jgi:ubiquinone/menaquinone biosynthesis C-methylase UbiE
MNDKRLEENRYDSRALNYSNTKEFNAYDSEKSYILDPIEDYYSLIKNISGSLRFLEIGAGMGENSEPILKAGHKLHSTDISSESVEIMKKRFQKYNTFSAETADMESLPFEDQSYDVVASSGSLSYGDNYKVLNEIYRVLKSGGIYIALDSLNNNPIYRFNRYIHYLKGNRSKSTLLRMPSLKLLNEYEKKFHETQVNFYGSLTWALPVLNIFLNEDTLRALSNKFDKKIKIKKSAFKFTMKAIKL